MSKQAFIAPHEAEQAREDFKSAVVVIIDGVQELPVPIKPFANDVPRVRTDRVIKPTGMPPEHWGLA